MKLLKTIFQLSLLAMTFPVYAEAPSAYFIGDYQVEQLILSPNPPKVGDQIVGIVLKDKEGNLITDAEVEIEAFMPEMGTMPFMSTSDVATQNSPGNYETVLDIVMGGTWELPIRVKRPGEASYTEFPFSITIGIDGFVYKGKVGMSQSDEVSDGPKVYLSEARQQLIGVEVGQVEYREMSQEIRTIARLEVDESKQRLVTLKVSGYIEKLYANKRGDWIEKGEPLFEIYSPELYTAQTEYLQLYQNAVSSRAARALLKTAREKLKLWDLSDEQIQQLEKRGMVLRQHQVLSPASGVLLEKKVYEGSFISAGEPLFEITDLSTLWALVDLFEHESLLVKEGNDVTLNLSHLPKMSISGKISYIYPTVSEKTRTIQARVALENPDLNLRPGMYANATIDIKSQESLVLPRRAVLFSGKHKYVFVALGDGYFEPREIQTGMQNGDWLEVTEGLSAGEHVSFSANFLISSEAQLRKALPRWGKPEKQISSESNPPMQHHHH